MSAVGQYWRTIRYLTSRQIVYQVRNRLRRRPRLHWQQNPPEVYFLTVSEADKPVLWQRGAFTFLNQRVSFPEQINWNYTDNGKLWTYHLTYFDFLNQPNVSAAEGLKLIRDFVTQTDTLRDGLESYPTSIRLTNWIQFLSRHQIRDYQINAHLFAQAHLLSRRLEYHLMGNHLLENGFALLIAALYFRHERWLRKGIKLVQATLNTQILDDGGHNERSPMYHQILLDRLLTVLLALQTDKWHNDDSFLAFLIQKAVQMLDWLSTITFRNGDLPMVNDATSGMAPTTVQLWQKADRILSTSYDREATVDVGSERRKSLRNTSGYQMFRQDRYELFVDAGAIGPGNQPGHAHADTFSFVLYVDNQPIIVDSGTSTYQTGQRRNWERSTAAHNTVEVSGLNSSEVWAAFRVGRRASVTVMRNTKTALTARHDGYRPLNIIHQRSWSVEPANLIIVDRLLTGANELSAGETGIARFHFHPGIDIQIVSSVVMAGPLQLYFDSDTEFEMHVTKYDMAEEFNTLRSAQCLEITFVNSLKTTLTLRNEHTLPDILFRT